MKKSILGIDPGKNGGLVLLSEEDKLISYYIPKKIGNEVDMRDLNDFFKGVVKEAYLEMVFLEDVHSVFGASANSNFQFGKICGILEGLVCGYDLPYIKVKPKDWQKQAFEGIPPIYKPSKKKGKGTLETKKMAEIAFKRIFPEYIEMFSITDTGRKSINIHDGLVDAILIALYGRRKSL